MDKKQCGECQLDINDLEPLRCGFCETFYHISMQCCGLNVRTLKDPLSTGKILFICHSCQGVLKGRSIHRFIADQQQQQQQTQPPSLASLPEQVQQLHEAVAELSKKVDKFSTKPQRNPSVSATPAWPKPGAKRRREERPDIVVPVVKGTKTIDLSDLSVPSISPTAAPEKFWLYLSRLNPLISDNDVHNIVSRCLDTTEAVDVIRLVPKGKDVSSMTFVSFKIGLDPDMKDAALDPASWHSGLQFREFIDSAKKTLPQLLTPPLLLRWNRDTLQQALRKLSSLPMQSRLLLKPVILNLPVLQSVMVSEASGLLFQASIIVILSLRYLNCIQFPAPVVASRMVFEFITKMFEG